MRKYKAIRDKKISGIAGPVIKAIGIKNNNVEKKITSNEIDLSVTKDLKGFIKKPIIIWVYIDDYWETQKKNAKKNLDVFWNKRF